MSTTFGENHYFFSFQSEQAATPNTGITPDEVVQIVFEDFEGNTEWLGTKVYHRGGSFYGFVVSDAASGEGLKANDWEVGRFLEFTTTFGDHPGNCVLVGKYSRSKKEFCILPDYLDQSCC